MLNLLGQGCPSAAPGIQSAHVTIHHNQPPYSPPFRSQCIRRIGSNQILEVQTVAISGLRANIIIHRFRHAEPVFAKADADG